MRLALAARCGKPGKADQERLRSALRIQTDGQRHKTGKGKQAAGSPNFSKTAGRYCIQVRDLTD